MPKTIHVVKTYKDEKINDIYKKHTDVLHQAFNQKIEIKHEKRRFQKVAP